MAKKKTSANVDLYANKFFASVTESAANTLTFDELQTNISMRDKVAWVLHRLEWFFPIGEINKLIDNADKISLALTSSDGIDSLDLSEPTVIDLLELQSVDKGTPANWTLMTQPIIRDFSQLPGGGIIIYPKPLFLGIKGLSLASAVSAECRGYFTVKDIDKETAFDLIDVYRLTK